MLWLQDYLPTPVGKSARLRRRRRRRMRAPTVSHPDRVASRPCRITPHDIDAFNVALRSAPSPILDANRKVQFPEWDRKSSYHPAHARAHFESRGGAR